jgi:hypothetical protein
VLVVLGQVAHHIGQEFEGLDGFSDVGAGSVSAR